MAGVMSRMRMALLWFRTKAPEPTADQGRKNPQPPQKPSKKLLHPPLPSPNGKAIDDGHPCIVIAGQAWPIPPLAPRQNRHVVAALMRMGGDLFSCYGDLLDIVFYALTRAHTDIRRDEFEEWPIPLYELAAALPTISKQTGMLKPGKVQPETEKPKPPDFDAIIAQFVNFLGWDWNWCEDNLTGRIIEAMGNEWRVNPPTQVLIRNGGGGGYIYKPPTSGLDAIEELLAMFPDGNLKAAGQTIH